MSFNETGTRGEEMLEKFREFKDRFFMHEICLGYMSIDIIFII